MRRSGTGRWPASRWLRSAAPALAGVAMMLVSSCGAAEPVVVTVTETPGQTQVTAPSLSDAVAPATSAAPVEPTSSASTVVPQIRVSADPAFGSTDIGPNQSVTITAFNSLLADVIFTGDDGSQIAGEISSDGHTWTRESPLVYGVTYAVSAIAEGPDGTQETFDGTYSVVDPEKTLQAFIQVPDGATVGIATPIIVEFAGPVTNRFAAEERLHVTTTDEHGNEVEIEGSWGWMQDEDVQGDGVMRSRVHYRTKDFWPGRTNVHVEANLYGVDYGSGWGRADLVRDFQIGENLKVEADVESHRLLVIQDDLIVKNFPVSYGVPATVDDGRTTVSGIHVITEKFEEYTMCNPKYGYCGFKAPWAVRINNNGEFIHVNPATERAGLLGKANISHGCVNMGMTDGKTFYDMVYYGVPVIVEHTGVEMGYGDYIWDWKDDFDLWKTYSAL